MIILSLFFASDIFAKDLFLTAPDEGLLKLKKCFRSEKEDCLLFVKKIYRNAEKSYEKGLFSVMDKKLKAPSEDKHDFFGLSIYYWQNPYTDSGFPYVFRDGEINPDTRTDDYDASALSQMSKAAFSLALSCYITKDDKHCYRAGEILRRWFLGEKTKMNPNLNYAHYIPGSKWGDMGSPAGIINANHFIQVIESIRLLKNSNSITDSEYEAYQVWFNDFLTWLKTSDLGKRHTAIKNNHGTWDDAVHASIAVFVGDKNYAAEVLKRVRVRVKEQIEGDGSMPMELSRTKSISYSLYNLYAHLILINIAENLDIRLKNYNYAGANVKKAVEYMLDAKKEDSWNYEQITEVAQKDYYRVLSLSCMIWGKNKFCFPAESMLKNYYEFLLHPEVY